MGGNGGQSPLFQAEVGKVTHWTYTHAEPNNLFDTQDSCIYNVYVGDMKYFNWNSEKNEKLIKERGVSFEICLVKIEDKDVLDILDSTNHPNQRMFVLEIDEYVYLVPFVENEEEIFLKTIIPSRKFTKKYLKSKSYI